MAKPQALPLLPAWPGLPVSRGSGQRFPPQPEPPPRRVTSADAPRLCPEPHPEQSLGYRCSHPLALDQLLGKITEVAFLSPALSGEKWDHSLLRSQTPGYLPHGPARRPTTWPFVCVSGSCLKVTVGTQLSRGEEGQASLAPV